MRERHHLGPLAVQAIGGTAVLMLGFDPDEGSATELLGFAVRRTDHTYLVRRWAELRRTRLRGRATDNRDADPDNQVAVGATIGKGVWGQWMKEVTLDVNKHVLSSTPSSCWSIRSATIRP